jgi:hypothetical protein
MFAALRVTAARSLGIALGGFALASALGACAAGDGETGAVPDPNDATCLLSITLSGGLSFESKADDTKACVSVVESGPGMDLTFIPLDRSLISAIEISAPSVQAGMLRERLPAVVTVEHADGRISRLAACQLSLLENSHLSSEKLGDRYKLRGTGACAAPDPKTGVAVSGPFAFASTTLWTSP